MFNYFSSSGNYAFETQLNRAKQRKLRRMMRPLISPSYTMLEIKAKSLRQHFREDNSKKSLIGRSLITKIFITLAKYKNYL